MKELHNKILDDFIAKNHEKSHFQFHYRLFQDLCHRLSIPSAYSRYLSDQHRIHQDLDKSKPGIEKKDRSDQEKR